MTIGRTARVTRNSKTRDEASNNGPPCLGDVFLLRQLMSLCQLGRLGRRLWKALARRQIRLALYRGRMTGKSEVIHLDEKRPFRSLA